MFGDNTTQATTTDNVINPAQPPAGMGDPLATTPPATDVSAFPAVPSNDDTTTFDDSTTVPAMPSSVPALDNLDSNTTEATPEVPLVSADGVEAAAPALPADDVSDDSSADDSEAGTEEETETQTNATEDTDTADLPEGSEELVEIKQEALEQLSPLVDKLDQSAEERFRTTMMMIQASDNQALIKQAYEAAQKISDDKARAQALLDVINEINYFTSKPTA